MATPATIPMISPDGSSGDIPVANLNAARQAGFKVAVTMTSPDGKNGYVPAERAQEAAAKGFKMVPQAVPEGEKPSFWETLTNPVGSGAHGQGVLGGVEQIGGQAIKALAQPVIHPLDTLQGMYQTVRHPMDTMFGMAQKVEQDAGHGGVPLALENVAGQAIGTAEGGRMMAPVAKSALDAVPAVAGRAVLLGKTPEAAYESALKPSTVLKPADRAAAIQTGLENGIPVSKGGLEKLGGLIDELNQKIASQIASDPNRPIDANMVATRADAARAKFANQVNPRSDLAAIEASRQEFLQNQGAGKPSSVGPQSPAAPMGAADAQAMKQGTYQVLKGKFGEMGSASVEAQKALARGLKEEIATQFPEIGDLNASEGKLLDLQPLLERAVNRISNHQLVGIGSPVAGTAAKAVTGSSPIGATVAILKSTLDDPWVKSRLAISISKGAKIPYSAALSRIAAYSTSLGSATHGSQEYSSDAPPTPVTHE